VIHTGEQVECRNASIKLPLLSGIKPSCQEGSISPLACMVPAIDKDTHGLQIRGRKGARFPKEKMRDERT